MYLDIVVKGKLIYVDNIIDMSNNNVKVEVEKLGIGIYIKNIIGSGKNNIINILKVFFDG